MLTVGTHNFQLHSTLPNTQFLFSVLQHKDERRKKDENILKQSHQLVAEVIEHSNFLHSLLVKTAIYGYANCHIIILFLYLCANNTNFDVIYIFRQTPDHPKLYLWSEQGSKVNEDPPLNKLEECKLILYR